MASPNIGRFKMHHYMYGIIMLAVGLALKNLIAYSVGFGLIIDELPLFLFPKDAHWKEYNQRKHLRVF